MNNILYVYYQIIGRQKIWFEVLISGEEYRKMQKTVCVGLEPPSSVHSRAKMILNNPILESVIASSELEGEYIPEWAKDFLREIYPTRYH